MQELLPFIDRTFAENVLGTMEWKKWNIIFDQVSQHFAFIEMVLGFNTHIILFCSAILDHSQTGEQL